MATGKTGRSRNLRLIVTPADSGSWNMAVDQALLQSVQLDRQPCLRLYQWSEPTLSLGYFQPVADRQQHPPTLACPVVRRATGGGAICHDREITYSLVTPVEILAQQDTRQLYGLVHQAIIDELEQQDVTATLRPAVEPTATNKEPFLCFLRKTMGDILIGTHKVGGSAQRRQQGIILQHGSLLLKQSPAAPELKGIEDLTQSCLNLQQWSDRWCQRLARQLDLHLVPGKLDEKQAEMARTIEKSRFDSNSWTDRR